MKVRALLYSTILLLLLTLLSGCGGGGGGGGGDTTPGSALTLGADAQYAATRAATRAEAVLGAKLDAGANVTAYELATGLQVATGVLDSSGFVTLTVPSDKALIVVITGTSASKAYRLSIVLAQVPVDAEYVADPATSITAEAVATKFLSSGKTLAQSDIDAVQEAAVSFVTSHPDADYSVGAGPILELGSGDVAGSIDGIELADVIAVVPNPDTVNDKIVLAKNAVQQIKEAGIPLEAMVSQERPDVEGIFTTEVSAKYDALWTRLNKLIIPAHGNLMYNGQRMQTGDLTMDQAYKVTDYNYGNPIIVDDPANNQAGQITITYETPPGEMPAGIYTVVAKKVGARWILTQTFSGDPQQEYVFDTPDINLGTNPSNPSYTATASVKDSNFTTPVTFEGAISATGPDTDHYTQITFTGTLSSPNVSSSGTFQANFPSSVPSGAEIGDKTYDFPISASMSNANITVTGGGTTIALTGNISVEMVTFMGDYGLEIAPKNITMTGTYDNSHSGLHFNGSITGVWTNAPTTGNVNAKGTLTLHGELTRVGHPTYYADISFALDSGNITSDIDLRAGANTLQGTASGTLDVNGNLGESHMTLTNQAGVQFNLVRSPEGVVTGNVKVQSEIVANIAESPLRGIRITYLTTPETFDDI